MIKHLIIGIWTTLLSVKIHAKESFLSVAYRSPDVLSDLWKDSSLRKVDFFSASSKCLGVRTLFQSPLPTGQHYETHIGYHDTKTTVSLFFYNLSTLGILHMNYVHKLIPRPQISFSWPRLTAVHQNITMLLTILNRALLSAFDSKR
jgi:hypothetical protein